MQTAKGGYVYILMNYRNTVNYTGATNSLIRRIPEHKEKLDPYSFTAKYNINKLVYFHFYETMDEAHEKELYIKGKSRQFKLELNQSINPNFEDLWANRESLGLE